MSADNGIYILKTKDQYRVIEAQAIENLFYSHIKSYNEEIVPTRVIEYFGNSRYTRNFETAMKIANYKEQNNYTEYGIKTFSIHKTWSQIIKDAKELALLELDELKKDNSRWKYQIKELEKIILM